MRVLRSTAVILVLMMMSAPGAAFGQAQSQPAAVAPEHQEMAAKRAQEREKITAIKSFMDQSLEAESKGDMRQADTLADRAQILAKDLINGKQ